MQFAVSLKFPIVALNFNASLFVPDESRIGAIVENRNGKSVVAAVRAR